MIDLCQSSVPVGWRPRGGKVTTSFSGLKFHRYDLLDIYTDSSPYRSKYDFLYQGKVFDRFGDKSVWNRQFSGKVFPKILIGGSHVPPPSNVTTLFGGDWLSSGKEPSLLTSRMANGFLVEVSFRDYHLVVIAPVRHLVASRSSQVLIRAHVSYTQKIGYYSRYSCSASISLNPDRVPYAMQQSIATDLLRSVFPERSEALPDIPAKLAGLSRQFLAIADSLAREMALAEVRSSPNVTTFSVFKDLDFRNFDDQGLETLLDLAYATVNGIHEWTTADLSTLGRQVIDNISDFSSNAIAYVGDLKKFGDSLRSILELVADIDNPKKWASVWLSMRFSDRLTIQDTHELLVSLRTALLDRQFYTKGRSRIDWSILTSQFRVSHTRTQTEIVSNNHNPDLVHLVDAMLRWDVWPTLENMWDMLPLSFVVDWFLPISDILAQIDASVQSPYLNSDSAYFGDRLEVDFSPNSLWSGDLTYVYYQRDARSCLSDVMPFEANISFIPSFGVVNAGDSLALAAQFALS